MAVNLLLSYAFHDKTDLAKVRRDLVCGLLMIDSGAFTAHTTGRIISLGEYADYLEHWRGCWDHAVTLDVIGDPEATARNTKKLHDRGLPVMPVFTRGGKLADFDAMVRDVGYVCAGGLVGLPKKVQQPRVGLLQQRALALGGGIHALGVGSMETLRLTRPYSADASNISGAFRFGNVIYFNGKRVVATPVTKTDVLRRDHAIIRAHGIDLGLLARTSRMPNKDGRKQLMQAMSLAYACADEQLKQTSPVPAPACGGLASGPHLYNSVIGQGATAYEGQDVSASARLDRLLHPGPHLYNSVVPEFGLGPAAGLDQALHADSPDLPPIWRRYGRTHTCTRTRRAPAHASSS